MRDRSGKVIYIGKAKDLRARVRAYFRGGDGRQHIDFLLARVADFDTLVTANEKEALILENNLIKQYKPRYNVRLKDDKSYLSIKVNLDHPWPRIIATRKIVKDGGRYFGPYSSAVAVRETIDLIEKYFLLRNCTEYNFKNRTRPCLQFQIKRCLAPCVLAVDSAEYRDRVRQAMLFIDGKSGELIDELRARMEGAAAALQFETAAKIRDQIAAVQKTTEKQRMLAHWGSDQDVFGLYREGDFLEIQVLFIRQGKLIGNRAYSLQELKFSDEDVLQSVLTQFYQGDRFVPDEILLPVDIDDRAVREEYLGERKGKKVALFQPARGDKRRLVDMAVENARQSFFERYDRDKERERTLVELQRRLRLKRYPQRIECFDISTIHGAQAVGSMVTFLNGDPDKNRYRHYRIRTVGPESGGDDFSMMLEVLRRRFQRGVAEADLPDLLVVDGGKGQLSMALTALAELKVEEIDVLALAKERVRSAPQSERIDRTPDRVFLPGRNNAVIPPSRSKALLLLQRVRDEAHRFAISYHKKLRTRQLLYSALDRVPGIGGARKRALLRAFGSVKRIEEATLDELLGVPSINTRLAEEIQSALRSLARK